MLRMVPVGRCKPKADFYGAPDHRHHLFIYLDLHCSNTQTWLKRSHSYHSTDTDDMDKVLKSEQTGIIQPQVNSYFEQVSSRHMKTNELYGFNKGQGSL